MKPANPKKRVSHGTKRSAAGGSGTRSKKRTPAADDRESSGSPASYNLRQRDASKQTKHDDDYEWDVDKATVEGEIEVVATPDNATAKTASPPPRRVSAQTKEQQALLSKELKDSLKRLKNLLKLPKARRWAFCEYFVADLDRALLQPDEEFRHCLRESFPDLRTYELRRAEWKQIRRLIGKPRRYSQAFLEYEREDLERKRNRIREIQKGAALTLDDDVDTPLKIPQPFVVGARVFARVRFPKDGIFRGTVDAVMDGRYRIIFDNDVVMPLIVTDSDLMTEKPDDLVPVSFFLEKNKAAQPTTYRSNFLLTCEKLLASDEVASLMQEQGIGAAARVDKADTETAEGKTEQRTAADDIGIRDERCGLYPLRMVVMLVKLAKLLERKKTILSLLREMNCEAERHQMRASSFSQEFQEKYAEIVIELEQIDKQLQAYLVGVGEYVGTLLPHLTEVAVTSRPDVLQKFCHMHASQIVKHTNITTTNVENRKTLDFITSLTSIMLQVRALGQQNCSAYELNSLKESLDEITNRLHPENRSIFEDHVEVSVKHVEMLMKGWRGPEAEPPSGSSTTE